MLNYIVGSDKFYEALTAYFEEHKYSNVDQFDLWKAMKAKGGVNGVDLAEVMAVWTKQAGHPVVTVTTDYASDCLIVTQKQFKRDPLAIGSDLKWTIPFTYSIESRFNEFSAMSNMNISNIKDTIEWVRPDASECIRIRGSSPKPDDFVLANIDMSGFYRVNYDKENWKKIINLLDIDKTNAKVLPRMKAQLLNDAFAFAQSLDVEADLPLRIVKALSQGNLDTAYLPWSVFLSRYGYYSDMFYSGRIGSDLKEKVAAVVEPLFNFLMNGTSQLTWNQRLIRSKVFEFACRHEVRACVEIAINEYSKAMSARSYEIVTTGQYKEFSREIACTAIRMGSKAEFDFMYLYDSIEMREIVSAALACTKDPALLQKYLHRSNEFAENERRIQAILDAADNTNGNYLVWNHVKTEWGDLVRE